MAPEASNYRFLRHWSLRQIGCSARIVYFNVTPLGFIDVAMLRRELRDVTNTSHRCKVFPQGQLTCSPPPSTHSLLRPVLPGLVFSEYRAERYQKS